MTVPGIREATGNLVEWSAREEWKPLHREVFEAHMGPFAGTLDAPAEDIANLLGDDFHILEIFIVEDFFAARFGGDGETNVVDDYLRRRGWRETAAARRYLEGLRDSTVSLYCPDSEVLMISLCRSAASRVRRQKRLIVARMSSADLVQRKGVGLALTLSM